MPPRGPGTAPRTISRFSPGTTSTTSRPFWVTRPPPMRPGPRIPLNTREGVAEAPIEPGWRTLCEPWLLGPVEKLWRLTVPWKPLPFETPETLTVSPGANASARTSSPIFSSPASPRNSARRRSGGAPALRRCPSSGLVSRFSRTSPKASWTASYPSRSAVRMPVTGHGPACSTVTRWTRPSSPNRWVMPSLRARIPGMALSESDLDVHAGGEVVEALERVDRLRRGLVNVDEPLVGADLEVLLGVLVLERRADHRV